MKLISVLKWEAGHNAVALVYADSASNLGTELTNITLTKGSMAYLASGEVYVLGDSWTKVGA